MHTDSVRAAMRTRMIMLPLKVLRVVAVFSLSWFALSSSDTGVFVATLTASMLSPIYLAAV